MITQSFIISCLIFLLISLSAEKFGNFFQKFKLPLISGFLCTGLIAGPYILKILSPADIKSLKFIDDFALAFIAFAAGSEVYLKEFKDRLKSIKWVTVGLVSSTFLLSSSMLYFISDYIPFMNNLDSESRFAIALLAGAILVARSPSSAIAIIKELRARGIFTKTTLGVTVIMDVVVIVLFSVCSSLAGAILKDAPFDFSFMLVLLCELAASIGLGVFIGKFIHYILDIKLSEKIKAGLILLLGYGVFVGAHYLKSYSAHNLSFEIFLEPLLLCMVAGFYVANYTEHRKEFLQILHDVAPPIYVAFFTLTGASIELDILYSIWHIAIILFGIRLVGIFIGSFTGGVIAGDIARHSQVSWMAYITQAGVGLGLAKNVADSFPTWGPSFASMIIAVIIINQLIGPIFFKWALVIVREAHRKGSQDGPYLGKRSALLFGQNGQAVALAKQLIDHNWDVKIVEIEGGELGLLPDDNIQHCKINEISLDALKSIGAKDVCTMITMLGDEQNFEVCEIAYEYFGKANLVSSLTDRNYSDKFKELGVLIANETTAYVSLLDHFVRAPSAASLFLGMEPTTDIIDIEVDNPSLYGMYLHDLSLPHDTLIISINRKGENMIDHGEIRLQRGDKITIWGSQESLEEVLLHFIF